MEEVLKLILDVCIESRPWIWFRPQFGLVIRAAKLQYDEMFDFASLLGVAVASVISGQAIALVDRLLLRLGHIADTFAVTEGADEADGYRIIDLHIRATLIPQTACHLFVGNCTTPVSTLGSVMYPLPGRTGDKRPPRQGRSGVRP